MTAWVARPCLKLLEEQPPIDTWFCFTVQEEVGLRGAAAALAYALDPDFALVLEGTTAADLAEVTDGKAVCHVRGGVVLPFMDGATIHDAALFELLRDACAKRGIAWQTKTRVSGGTDAGRTSQKQGRGARLCGRRAGAVYPFAVLCGGGIRLRGGAGRCAGISGRPERGRRMSKVFDLWDTVGGAFGPSGREDAVREAIAAIAGEYIDDITTDALGNLICRKKGAGKKLLFAAHMDSIGAVATYIDEKGFIRFAQVGGLFKGDLINIQVRFAGGTRGVISYEEKTPFKDITLDNLFIDIGAADRADAERQVQIGDFAVFDAPRFEQNGVLCGPYLDNRIGCVTLLLVMERLAQQEIENDLYFAFTAQEEVGLRGAGAAAFAVEPDIAVAVDVTDTGDLPERKTPMAVDMGRGPAVKVMDRSVICTPEVCAALERAAAACGIDVQREILQFGGTDTAALQKTRAGVQAGAVSIPTRYIHSPSEMCAVSDVEAAARLLEKFVLQQK